MNIRGAMHFPELSGFCDAVRHWAHALCRRPRTCNTLVVLAIDHGLRQESFALSATLAVAFSGEADADTLIVNAVDALLAAGPRELRVVTSDHLLRMRCRHALPADATEVPLGGAQRSPEQLAMLKFESSDTFAHGFAMPAPAPSSSRGSGGRALSPSDVFSASPARGRPGDEFAAADAPPPPMTKRARRKVERRAEAQHAKSRHCAEGTADRVASAAALHRRVERRHAQHASTAHASSAVRDGVAATWTRWFHACAVPLRHAKQPSRAADSPAWWGVPPGAVRTPEEEGEEEAEFRSRIAAAPSAGRSPASSGRSASGSAGRSGGGGFGEMVESARQQRELTRQLLVLMAIGAGCLLAAALLPADGAWGGAEVGF